MKVNLPNFDDKDLVIFAAAAIAIIAMYQIADSNEIILAALSGMFGLAVGRGQNGDGGG